MLNGIALQGINVVTGLVAQESENSQVEGRVELQSDVNV